MLKQQTWIRNGWWDGFWILSGLPLGLLLLSLSSTFPQKVMMLVALILLQNGHLLSPIFLAWSHRGFRGIMLRHKFKYIVTPLLIVASLTLTGFFASQGFTQYRPDLSLMPQLKGPIDYRNPYVIMIWIYMIWNMYHFGMQNFGILSIYRYKTEPYPQRQRGFDKAFCLASTLLSTPFLLTYSSFRLIHTRADFEMMQDIYILRSRCLSWPPCSARRFSGKHFACPASLSYCRTDWAWPSSSGRG
jgi:hypothetical protein